MKRTGILIEGLKKQYGSGETQVDALKGVEMQVAPGEVVGLVGPSGSGKSTLLKCLGAVIEPSAGRMTLGQKVIYDGGWKIKDLRALRRDNIGFVFQAPYLIPSFKRIYHIRDGRTHEEAGEGKSPHELIKTERA